MCCFVIMDEWQVRVMECWKWYLIYGEQRWSLWCVAKVENQMLLLQLLLLLTGDSWQYEWYFFHYCCFYLSALLPMMMML